MKALVCPNEKCLTTLDFGDFTSILTDGFTSTTPCCRTSYTVRVVNDDVELQTDQTCRYNQNKKRTTKRRR